MKIGRERLIEVIHAFQSCGFELSYGCGRWFLSPEQAAWAFLHPDEADAWDEEQRMRANDGEEMSPFPHRPEYRPRR